MTPFWTTENGTLYQGHALDILRTLPDNSIQCCITSPPYWGLRDYGIEPTAWDDPGGCAHDWIATEAPGGNGSGESSHRNRKDAGRKRGTIQAGFCSKCHAWKGCLGLEPSPYLYMDHITEVFREVRRVLKKSGTLWLNLGDCYATGAGKVGDCPGGTNNPDFARRSHIIAGLTQPNRMPIPGLKPKDLCMIPFRVALALQDDGWFLRSVIPWLKRNVMPESCKDRPTTLLEYVFLLSKSRRYFYDAGAVMLPSSPDTHARYGRARSDHHKFHDGGPGHQTITRTFDHIPGVNPKAQKAPSGWKTGPGSHRSLVGRHKQNPSFSASVKNVVELRNRRTYDWLLESFEGLIINEENDPTFFLVNTHGFPGEHFATFPPEFIEPMILAGSSPGDNVLDPFFGTGTVGLVAERHSRTWTGLEISASYCEMAKTRITERLWGPKEKFQKNWVQESLLKG